jgi:aminocarboxymuconate-semialdehyde decarboxylase
LKIDVHAHLIPQTFVEPVTGETPLPVRIFASGTQQPIHTQSIRALSTDAEQLYNIERRLADMDAQLVDMHVLSVAPMLFVYDLERPQAIDAFQQINNALAEVVNANADRFVAIADLPMQSPEDAARELERAVRDLGLRGAEICSNIGGKNLNDKSFAPVWRKMEELDVPFFIHPANVLGMDRLGDFYLNNLIGNPTDTAVAAASLIFGGVLKEFPRLKFYLAHGGGSCPYLRGRWDHGWKMRPEGKVNITRPPSEYFKLLYFDSLVHGGFALNYLVDTVGPERVMMGTDYPFDMGDYNSVDHVLGIAHQSDAARFAVLGDTAQQLFKI